jgi:hypothetical protein
MIISISGKLGSGKDLVGKIVQYLLRTHATDNELIGRGVSDTQWIEILDAAPNTSPFIIKKWAGKLKQVVSLFTGIPVEDLEKEEVKDRVLEHEWDRRYYGCGHCNESTYTEEILSECPTCSSRNIRIMYAPTTVRWLLQHIGTDALRNQIHPNIHINGLMVDYKLVSVQGGTMDYSNINGKFEPVGKAYVTEYPDWLITDTRFLNEADAVKPHGFNLRVTRPIDLRFPKLWEIYPHAEIIIEPDEDVFYDWLNGHDHELWKKLAHNSETGLDHYLCDEYIFNVGSVDDLISKVKEILVRRKMICQ